MSKVRNKAVRATRSNEEKLRLIRALYVLVYNDPASIIPLAVELFHTLGHILEGVSPEELELYAIDKQRLLRELVQADIH